MELSALIHQSRIEEWKNVYSQWQMYLFSPQWWALFILVAISYIVWWKLADKNRLSHLLLFGSFVTVMRVIFDDVVAGLGLYSYSVSLVPLPRALVLNDLTVVPLFYMLVYQFTSSWRNFFLCSIVWSGIWSFVFKPLFVSFGILTIYDWKYYYTFIVVLLIGVLSRFAFLLVMRVEKGGPLWHSIGAETETIFHLSMKPLANNEQDDEQSDKRDN